MSNFATFQGQNKTTIECGNCGIKKEVSMIDAMSPNNINWSTIWRPLRGGILFCCNQCKTIVPYADSFERGDLLFCCDKCKTTVPYADSFEREVK